MEQFCVHHVWHVWLLLKHNTTDAERNVNEDEGIKGWEEAECRIAAVNYMFSDTVKIKCALFYT